MHTTLSLQPDLSLLLNHSHHRESQRISELSLIFQALQDQQDIEKDYYNHNIALLDRLEGLAQS